MKTSGIHKAIFCGEAMKYGSECYVNAIYMKTKELLIAYLNEYKFSNSTILIKASRGMALEDIVAYI